MLDFADVVAINKFERRGAEDALRDVRRQLVRNREAFGAALGGHAGVRHQRRPLQRRRRHRALPAPARPARRATGLTVRRGPRCRASTRKASTGSAAVVPPSARALPRRDRRDRPRLPRARPSEQAELARAAPAPADRARQAVGEAGADAARTAELERAERALPAEAAALLDAVAARPSRRTPATSWSCTVRDRELRTPLTRETLSGTPVRRVALPRYDRPRRAAALPARGEPAGPLPVHRRGVPVQARGRGPGADVRRRGRRRSAPTGASTCCREGQPATRLSTAFDSVTLYGRDPDTAPGHLRQGRHLRACRSRRSTT